MEAAAHILGVKSKCLEACGIAFTLGIRGGVLRSPAFSPSSLCAVSVDCPLRNMGPWELVAETRALQAWEAGSPRHPALQPSPEAPGPSVPASKAQLGIVSIHLGPQVKGQLDRDVGSFSNRFYDSQKALSSSNSSQSISEVGSIYTCRVLVQVKHPTPAFSGSPGQQCQQPQWD